MFHVTKIFCTCQFESFHRWSNAPSIHEYLSQPHRHMFHVKVWCLVKSDDRDIEFIWLKRKVLEGVNIIRTESPFDDKNPTMGWSCERWCVAIQTIDKRICRVEVSEDGENGAVVDFYEDEIKGGRKCTQ